MKIMVVGGSGYIGRHVAKNLAAQGAEVVAFDVANDLALVLLDAAADGGRTETAVGGGGLLG